MVMVMVMVMVVRGDGAGGDGGYCGDGAGGDGVHSNLAHHSDAGRGDFLCSSASHDYPQTEGDVQTIHDRLEHLLLPAGQAH